MEMREAAAFCSARGARERNEDFVTMFSCGNVTVLLVSDGLGGYKGGEIASQTVAETVKNCFEENPEMSVENIRQILGAANQNVLDLHADGGQMRATVVAAFISEEKIIVAHAGDSRCYLFGRFGILWETRDHSVSRMAVDMGALKKKDIRISPDRNKVLRSLGSEDYKSEIQEIPISLKKVKGILLCTDGFWQNVLEKEMQKSLRRSRDAQSWLDGMVQILEKRNDTEQDNYSAITMKGWKCRHE